MYVVVAQLALELALLPAGGSLGTKKLLPHVVVDTDDGHSLPAKCRLASEPIKPAEPVTMAMLILLDSSFVETDREKSG